MLIPVDLNKEFEKTSKLELDFIQHWGLSYSELQDIPIKVIKVWIKQEIVGTQKKIFQEMVKKNANIRN